ncbi:hypothetical protein N7495_002893 [Penicillium taxi]|uniref:uncharacterized protein n=1 Tax=Penicillium taxi TaxID=168475 RepID=UPI0025458488|nr:uncharacterized protein N7495_002893 [Penicillium taxi]KAJ5902365.1 hypothetical protein N7495_002893 [Penicillium taxi]
MSTPSRSLQASALSFFLLSVGHTVDNGLLKRSLRVFPVPSHGLAGLSDGLLHYQWARNPAALNDPLNKIMAGIVNAALWASSAWYAKNNIMDTAWVVGLAAALQAYAVLI